MAHTDLSKMIVGNDHKQRLPQWTGTNELRSNFDEKKFREYADAARLKIAEADNLEFYMACIPSEVAATKHHFRCAVAVDRGELPF